MAWNPHQFSSSCLKALSHNELANTSTEEELWGKLLCNEKRRSSQL